MNKKKEIRRAAKQITKKLTPSALLLLAAALVLGALLGYFAVAKYVLPYQYTFSLDGEKAFVAHVGDTFTYKEEGFSFSLFGQDLSSSVKIETTLTRDESGVYHVDTATPGVYYIAYTSTHPFLDKGTRLVRTFTVLEVYEA